jgi:hypothetical protein
VVSIVVLLMLAVLPNARGRGFDSRSRLLHLLGYYILCTVELYYLGELTFGNDDKYMRNEPSIRMNGNTAD